MKEPEKILEAKDICKAYGKNMVLNQVNLTIKAGEIYGLVGENGAGKSSLMKVITGLTKPTSGEISLFGKKNLEDERNKIGCLIENPALYMDMTARQNLEIQRTQRGIPGKSSIDEVLEIRQPVARRHVKKRQHVGAVPVKVRRDVVGRNREREDAALGVALGHDLDVGSIDHVHFLLQLAVGKGHLFAADKRMHVFEIFRAGPVKREIRKRRLRAPAARDVQVVDELLNALQHFLVGRVVLADEGLSLIHI